MEPTLADALEDLRIAIGVLMQDLVLSLLKVIFLPVRFFLWLNGG